MGEERRQVYEYFGSFTRAMLSMFEITLANWPPICRMLSENVSPWFMLFAVCHKLSVGFTVVAVIQGVFIQETFKAASNDDNIMIRQKEIANTGHRKKMQAFLEFANSTNEGTGDGTVSLELFRQMFEDPDLKLWFSSMELVAYDVDRLFHLLDVDGDGRLTADEIMVGVGKLRGTARSIDLWSLTRDLEEFRTNLHSNLT